jgi:hypothetical protein
MAGAKLLGWLGGAAIACGIGFAASVASADVASAAPSDSSGSVGSHNGTASSAREVKSMVARKASPARVQRSVATPKPAAVAGAARREHRAGVAPAGYSPLDRIVTFKNVPLALPLQTVFFVKQVAGNATFTENSVYDLHNVDQYDWNKLTGISFTFWRPDTDAIMVAWRYNVDTQMFEIGPYYNLDTARIMPTDDEIISVPVGEKFTFNADYQGITLQYGDTVVYKPIPEGLHPNQLSAYRINSWFGGTSLPPKTISYYMRLKPWWKTL